MACLPVAKSYETLVRCKCVTIHGAVPTSLQFIVDRECIVFCMSVQILVFAFCFARQFVVSMLAAAARENLFSADSCK